MVETFLFTLQISILLAAAGWIGLSSLGRLPGSPVPSVAGLLKRGLRKLRHSLQESE